MTVRTAQTRLTVINSAQPRSLSVGTTAAFPTAGFVTERMTVVTAVMRTASAKPKPAVPRRSSVLDHICVSLSAGSATETKTVLTELTRVSKLAVCSTTRAPAMSSCAKTDSASPSTLCATMTTTAATALMSPWSVNIRHVDPTSSVVPTDAASSRVHGSVMETLTAMTTQTKPPRTHAALEQRRNATTPRTPAIMETVSMRHCSVTTRMTVATAQMN